MSRQDYWLWAFRLALSQKKSKALARAFADEQIAKLAKHLKESV